ncbi:MAG: hypothetical protein H7Z41_17450 [Cytophagales bacterium]|nr:hypothetical protein [Armatimonadota bacterium]
MRRIAVRTKIEDTTASHDTTSVVEDAAYPHYIVADDQATAEPMLSAAFHERNLSHLIGRRTGQGVWPDDPEDKEAVRLFELGQKALYEDKDAAAAICAYESALARDEGYIKAWVALTIAYISDNTTESLRQAEDTLESLSALPISDWLTGQVSSIIFQNLAYLHVHYYRQGRGRTHLAEADRRYAVADERSAGRERIELICPWAFVKMELGQTDAARTLWERAEVYSALHGTPQILKDYAGKYAPLRTFLHP